MATDSDGTPSNDLGTGLDGQELYTVLRKAIEDAMLSVLGTLVLVGIAALFVLVGAYIFFTGPDPVGPVIGAGVILLGFYLGGVTFGVIRPVRDWF